MRRWLVQTAVLFGVLFGVVVGGRLVLNQLLQHPAPRAVEAQERITTPATTAIPVAPSPTPLATVTLPDDRAAGLPRPTPPPARSTPSPTPTLPPHGQTAPVPILMYHYIRPKPANDPLGAALSVDPETFAAQMDWLAAHGYTTLTLHELAEVRAGKIGLPPKPIVLTFDDGYRDFYTAAWPVLKRHGFKATIFIITGVVGNPQYMTWDMLRELDRSGLVEVGGHTVHHLDLTQLNASALEHEVADCKQTLETQLGHPIASFAYPAGRFNETVVSAVQRAGFTLAVTTKPGWARATDAPLVLPRVRIQGDLSLAGFADILGS